MPRKLGMFFAKRQQGQRIVRYEGNEEKVTVLEALKAHGFKCKSSKIDLNTSTQEEIDWYIYGMPIGIDFEKREFFSCSVTLAIHGRGLYISTDDVLKMLRKKKRVKLHPAIKIY